MIDNIRTAGTGPVYGTNPTQRTKAAAPPVTGSKDSTIPATPPAEVLHALDRAQEIIADLASKNLEIRFDVTDGHVRTKLIDKDGHVVQEIPVRHGLDLLDGAPLLDHKA
jgi:hypothetical protein